MKTRLSDVIRLHVAPSERETFLSSTFAQVGDRWPAVHIKMRDEAKRRHVDNETMLAAAKGCVSLFPPEPSRAEAADALCLAANGVTIAELPGEPLDPATLSFPAFAASKAKKRDAALVQKIFAPAKKKARGKR